MRKVKRKYEKIEVYLTSKQKEDIKKLTELSGKNSMSEFILDTIFDVRVGRHCKTILLYVTFYGLSFDFIRVSGT